MKQLPAQGGYYINVADARTTFYQNTGSDAAPAFGQSVSTMSSSGAYVSTLVATPGAGIFRDHGKTLLSSGRVFRKVQLQISSATTSGVGGLATTTGSTGNSGYLTGYIELPGSGNWNSGLTSNAGAVTFTPVARLG